MAVVYTYYKYIIDKENAKCYVFPKDYAKPDKKKWIATCRRKCAKGLAVALCVTVILVAISDIAVTVTNGLATKLYSSDLSGRLVAMAVLALTAAVTLAASVYTMVGLIKKERKPLHVAGVVLFVMAIIQALLCGIAVKVSPHDEATLSNSLTYSFNQALEGNPRHYKLWEITNSGLQCCGLNGPEDYQDLGSTDIFGPNVPISCCANYDSSRSDLVQEKERQKCRARKDFYYIGCGALVKAGLRNSASAVLSITIFFIVLEVLLVAMCWTAYRLYQKREKEQQKQEPQIIPECLAVHVQPVQATLEGNTQVSEDTQVSPAKMEVKVDENEPPVHS